MSISRSPIAAVRTALMVGGAMLIAFGGRGATAQEPEPPSRPGCHEEDQRRYKGRTIAQWREVIKSLELSSPAAVEAVPGLIVLCRNSDVPAQTRMQAAYTLGRIGAAAKPAVPVLIELLQPPSERERAATAAWSAKALSLFGPVAAPATPPLVTLSVDVARPVHERLAAIEALGRIGGAHPDAIPALIQLASGSHPQADSLIESQQVQAAAIDSLALVGAAANAAVPSLIRLTRSESADLRRRASTTLGAIGPPAGIAAEVLVDLVLFDSFPEVRAAAVVSLARIGVAGEAALRQLLTDEDTSVRRQAAAAFTGVSRLTVASRQALVAALGDPDIDVRLSAVESLHKAGHDPHSLIPVLLTALTDEQRQPRIRAYRILIRLHDQASVLLPRLRELADDPRPHVRQVAGKAIEKLAQADVEN